MSKWHRRCVGWLTGLLVLPTVLWAATFELHNKETVVGDLTTFVLTVEPALGGELRVPLESLLMLDGDRFTLADGTLLTGKIKDPSLTVKARMGIVQIPVAQIKRIVSGKASPTVTPSGRNIFTLQNGDMLVGEFAEPIALELALGGTIEKVAPKEFISWADDRFTFQDGTVLKGRMKDESFTVKTRFGTVKVARADLKSLQGGQGSSPGTTTPRPGLASGGVPEPGLPQPPKLLEKTFRNTVGMDFVLVPAGDFIMGSQDGLENEAPIHAVRISQPFYLGKHEVTQGQWTAVMQTNPSHFRSDAALPVEQVSWEDVQEFISRLNTLEGKRLYRLPTEAEWEYAARAGSSSAYSFGDNAGMLPTYAWHVSNAVGTTHAVGTREPNAWGLYDMYGNVWEWVHDWYGAYPTDVVTDPPGPEGGEHRVVRGGGWGDDAKLCRSTTRYVNTPSIRYTDLGFRLVRIVQ